MRLTQIIEALLFASDAPLSAGDLARVDERLDEDTVQAVINELRAEYDAGERSFSIYEIGGGYQLLTRPEFVAVLDRYQTVPQPSKLSMPALEVLAIIAYRQPIGRIEVEDIRGVSSSGVLRTLQDRGLIETVARAEGLGRPLLYGTTRRFLEHCGFRSLEDLPRPDELPVVLRSRNVAGDSAASPTESAAAVPAGAASEPEGAASEPEGVASEPEGAASEPEGAGEVAAPAPPESIEREPGAADHAGTAEAAAGEPPRAEATEETPPTLE